jgi:hypothetical protein
MTGLLHINVPDSIAVRRISYCPTCDKRRRFSGTDALWYGPIWTCLGCGDRWSDGERLERPFKRGWREASRRDARKVWDTAVRLSGPEHRMWLDAQLTAEQEAVERMAAEREVA